MKTVARASSLCLEKTGKMPDILESPMNNPGYTMDLSGLEKLFGFDGYMIDSISFSEHAVHMRIHPDRRRRLECPDCGKSMWKNGVNPRAVQVLPLCGADFVLVQYDAIQGRCKHCGAYATFHPGPVTGLAGSGAFFQQAAKCPMIRGARVPFPRPVGYPGASARK